MSRSNHYAGRTRTAMALCCCGAIVLSSLLGAAQVYGEAARPRLAAAQVVVWNGESSSRGGSPGAGWSVPSSKDIFLKTQSHVAHSGRSALQWRVFAKAQWAECGWEWLGWWPQSRGTDISPKKKLTFWVRVLGEHKPRDLNVALKSSDKKKQLPTVNVRRYNADYADGKWHQIKIPLKDMFNARSNFNAKKASQIFLGTWNEQADFSIYVDDIAFE